MSRFTSSMASFTSKESGQPTVNSKMSYLMAQVAHYWLRATSTRCMRKDPAEIFVIFRVVLVVFAYIAQTTIWTNQPIFYPISFQYIWI